MEGYPNLVVDIRNILASADASLISAKMVRKTLQQMYPEMDCRGNKEMIDKITLNLFQDEQSSSDEEASKPLITRTPPSSIPSGSGSTLQDYKIPKIKKRARVTHLETDEEYARNLAREEASGSRTTRGEVAGKVKKSTWGKSKKEVDPNAPPRKVSNTGFNKPHLLSSELSAVCGNVETLSRPGVTKALWVYIKANELQDPKCRTDILPDALLGKVLPYRRINSFKMAKEISRHLFPYTAPPAEPDFSD